MAIFQMLAFYTLDDTLTCQLKVNKSKLGTWWSLHMHNMFPDWESDLAQSSEIAIMTRICIFMCENDADLIQIIISICWLEYSFY